MADVIKGTGTVFDGHVDPYAAAPAPVLPAGALNAPGPAKPPLPAGVTGTVDLGSKYGKVNRFEPRFHSEYDDMASQLGMGTGGAVGAGLSLAFPEAGIPLQALLGALAGGAGGAAQEGYRSHIDKNDFDPLVPVKGAVLGGATALPLAGLANAAASPVAREASEAIKAAEREAASQGGDNGVLLSIVEKLFGKNAAVALKLAGSGSKGSFSPSPVAIANDQKAVRLRDPRPRLGPYPDGPATARDLAQRAPGAEVTALQSADPTWSSTAYSGRLPNQSATALPVGDGLVPPPATSPLATPPASAPAPPLSPVDAMRSRLGLFPDAEADARYAAQQAFDAANGPQNGTARFNATLPTQANAPFNESLATAISPQEKVADFVRNHRNASFSELQAAFPDMSRGDLNAVLNMMFPSRPRVLGARSTPPPAATTPPTTSYEQLVDFVRGKGGAKTSDVKAAFPGLSTKDVNAALRRMMAEGVAGPKAPTPPPPAANGGDPLAKWLGWARGQSTVSAATLRQRFPTMSQGDAVRVLGELDGAGLLGPASGSQPRAVLAPGTAAPAALGGSAPPTAAGAEPDLAALLQQSLQQRNGGKVNGNPQSAVNGDGEDEQAATQEPLSAYDQAVRGIESTQAVSRFTRTPISIEDPVKQVDALVKSLGPDARADFDRRFARKEGTGSYDPKAQRINISLSPNSDYGDFGNLVHHEDIHALLDKAGVRAPDVQPSIAPGRNGLMNFLKYFSGQQALFNAGDGFSAGDRAGDRDTELPAYMGAFKQSQLPGVTTPDRMAYELMLKNALPGKTFEQYKRIIQSYNASQNR